VSINDIFGIIGYFKRASGVGVVTCLKIIIKDERENMKSRKTVRTNDG